MLMPFPFSCQFPILLSTLFKEVPLQSNKKAIMRGSNPVASAKAKPIIAKENNCPLI
jgi:hypothetical protein